ncbi:MAG: sugar kinase [Planctomycetes bacterium]|nr:sugar kinase [Planctomycetota bacterium]
MSLLVTGSIGIDTVTSPFGRAENVLGGSAVYFSFAASYYVPVRLVGVVGEDFPADFRDLLGTRRIDTSGLEIRKGSRTFRWTGKFEGDMNEAQTVEVDLNVLAERGPRVPSQFADSSTVFLANTHPTLQRELLSQLHSPKMVVCDTMNLWITTEHESLLETFRKVDGVILNDGEARQLTRRTNLIDAAEAIRELGPKFVVIKKGEHGALMVGIDGPVALPAFPTREVRDPTGAGDSFAGGFLGYLCSQGNMSHETLKMGLLRGTVAASFTIEDFSLRRIERLSKDELESRVEKYTRMLRFDAA